MIKNDPTDFTFSFAFHMARHGASLPQPDSSGKNRPGSEGLVVRSDPKRPLRSHLKHAGIRSDSGTIREFMTLDRLVLNGLNRKRHDGEEQERGPENQAETLSHLAPVRAVAMAAGFP